MESIRQETIPGIKESFNLQEERKAYRKRTAIVPVKKVFKKKTPVYTKLYKFSDLFGYYLSRFSGNTGPYSDYIPSFFTASTKSIAEGTNSLADYIHNASSAEIDSRIRHLESREKARELCTVEPDPVVKLFIKQVKDRSSRTNERKDEDGNAQ